MPLWKSASDGLAEQNAHEQFASYTQTEKALIQVVQLVVETDKNVAFFTRGVVWCGSMQRIHHYARPQISSKPQHAQMVLRHHTLPCRRDSG